MAIDYQVNSNEISAVPVAQWNSITSSDLTDGSYNISDWYDHIWIIAKMPMVDYEFLDSLVGKSLVEIITTQQNDPNTEATYTSAVLQSIEGRHIGLNMHNVRVQFKIDTGSLQ